VYQYRITQQPYKGPIPILYSFYFLPLLNTATPKEKAIFISKTKLLNCLTKLSAQKPYLELYLFDINPLTNNSHNFVITSTLNIKFTNCKSKAKSNIQQDRIELNFNKNITFFLKKRGGTCRFLVLM